MGSPIGTHDIGFTKLNRAIGAVIGSAVGDALGAGYEFVLAPEPADVKMKRGTLTGQPAGCWTDDTAMAIAILEVAARNGTLTTPESAIAVGDRFLEWFHSSPSDVGGHTKKVLSRARSGIDLADSAAVVQGLEPDSAGNGSLMRTGPVALAHLGNDEELAVAARAMSALTHAHPDAVEACVLWTIAIDRAVRLGTLEGPRAGLPMIEEDRRAKWAERIDLAENMRPKSFELNGYVVTALQAAWSAIFWTQSSEHHFEVALREAVAIGYDTDTVAAIAGALVGARYGANSIPPEWREGLAGWPAGYRDAELAKLAALAAFGPQG
jgi:ADP-ribosylglycohydrolase